MNIILEPKSNGDDAKFAINKEELATIKHTNITVIFFFM